LIVAYLSLAAQNTDLIERALDSYHKKTCIKFIPRRSTDIDYISIQNSKTGCWSSVGRIQGKQIVNLQVPGCVKKIGTIIHELLHVVGFLHEQNREDRDKFVKIVKQNVIKEYEGNFEKAKKGDTDSFGVGYDYGSVMHYSTTAFSKNGLPTIEAKQKTKQKPGQREGFSIKDIKKVNYMYNCKQSNETSLEITAKPSASIFGSVLGFLPH
jgi:hypothetical protein